MKQSLILVRVEWTCWPIQSSLSLQLWSHFVLIFACQKSLSCISFQKSCDTKPQKILSSSVALLVALGHILGRLSSKSTERTKKILVKTTCIVYHELKNDKNPKSERKDLNTNIRLWFSHERALGLEMQYCLIRVFCMFSEGMAK